MSNLNSIFGPPPLATPITQDGNEFGIPFQDRGLPRGDLNTAWWQWFNALFVRIQETPETLISNQAGLVALAATLGPNDKGVLVYVSDYAHMLQWNGTAFTRGPGDNEHSDSFHDFGAAPTDIGWHACDGSTVPFLQYDGTLGSRILPNLATAAYRKNGNAYSAAIAAAAVPTFAGVSSGSVTVQAGTGASAAPPFTPAGTITLTGDPVNHFLVITYYRQ